MSTLVPIIPHTLFACSASARAKLLVLTGIRPFYVTRCPHIPLSAFSRCALYMYSLPKGPPRLPCKILHVPNSVSAVFCNHLGGLILYPCNILQSHAWPSQGDRNAASSPSPFLPILIRVIRSDPRSNAWELSRCVPAQAMHPLSYFLISFNLLKIVSRIMRIIADQRELYFGHASRAREICACLFRSCCTFNFTPW